MRKAVTISFLLGAGIAIPAMASAAPRGPGGEGRPAAEAPPGAAERPTPQPEFAGSAKEHDWPQWRGQRRDGISRETGLLGTWPKEGPPLAWKVEGLGGGYSAPSVAAGRIFGTSLRGEDEVVWALSEADGSTLWVARLGPAARQRMPQGKEGPGSTPTVDGELLYALGLSGDLACLQVRDGAIVWRRSLPRDFGGLAPTWSFRESPLADGDKVICTPGGEGAVLVALDKRTGEEIWRSAAVAVEVHQANATSSDVSFDLELREKVPSRDASGAPPAGRRHGFGRGFGGSGAAYASAIAVDFEGERQYVQLTATGLVGVAASDGRFLWRYDRPANTHRINCATPIYHDGFVFTSSAYDAGGGLVKLTKDGAGGIRAEEVYYSEDLRNHHGGVVLFEGCLYGASGGNEGGYLVCLDFRTGKLLWSEEERGKRRAPKGSVALADGRLYYRTESGAMLLIEPSPKEYIERGRFEQPHRSRQPAWAHPVVANGRLYLRDQDVLLCYHVKAK